MRRSTDHYGSTVTKARFLIEAGVPLICFNLETTGSSPVQERILSFSAIKCVFRKGIFEEIERKSIFINPERPIPPEITEVNHIDYDMVRDCPKEDVAVKEIKDFFGDHPFICGYNSTTFDEKFIRELYLRTMGEEFTPIFHLDVLLMAREKLKSESYKLSDIAHLLGVDRNLEFHNSIDDVLAAFWIFRLLLDKYDDTEEERPAIILKVKGANWYEPSHRVRRVYVSTYPYSRTYYDACKSEWVSDTDGVDLERLAKDTFDLFNVSNEKELVRLMSGKK